MANWGAGVGAGFLLEMSLQLQAFSTHSCSESQTRGKGSSSRKSRYPAECARTEKLGQWERSHILHSKREVQHFLLEETREVIGEEQRTNTTTQNVSSLHRWWGGAVEMGIWAVSAHNLSSGKASFLSLQFSKSTSLNKAILFLRIERKKMKKSSV